MVKQNLIAMTRVTNFGLKRTYLEAGFSNDESKETALVTGGEPSPSKIHDPSNPSSEAPPPKKKRKRTPKSKRDGNLAKVSVEAKDETRENESQKGDAEASVKSGTTAPATGKSAKRKKKNREKGDFFFF